MALFPQSPVSFSADGLPITKGSGTAMVSRTTRKAIYVPDSRKALRAWTKVIRIVARNAWGAEHVAGVGISLAVTFRVPRGRGGKTMSRELRDREHPHVKPDLDKLTRTLLDALTGVVYQDDAQVVEFSELRKVYVAPERAGVDVTVRIL